MKTTKKPCSVCGDGGHGLHFGAESCSACAAFFRRSIAKQQKYRCKAFGRCEINTSVRCMCRACRFAKCLKVGMRKEAVQKHRSLVQEKPVLSSSTEPTTSSESKAKIDVSSFEDNMPSLYQIKTGYSQLEAARKVVHNRDGKDVFSNTSPKAVNYQEACKSNQKEIKLGIAFLEAAFPEFLNLHVEQKKVLYNHFFLAFLLLEGGYFCSMNDRTDIIVLPSGNYIDCKRPETFYYDHHNKQSMTTEDAVRLFASSFEVYRRNLYDPMKKQKITDIEFYALTAFVLWEHGLSGVNDDTVNVAKEVRDRIGRELVYYYSNVLEDLDYGVRLTNTLTLLRSLQRAVRRFQQDVEISNVLNAYAVDSNVYEIMNGKIL